MLSIHRNVRHEDDNEKSYQSESELVDQCEVHCGPGSCDQLTTNDFVDFVGCKRKGDHRLFWILSGLIRSVFQTQNP